MEWIEVNIPEVVNDVDFISDALMCIGATSVSISNPNKILIDDSLYPITKDGTINAFFNIEFGITNLKNAIKYSFPNIFKKFKFEIINDEDFIDNWKKFVKPIKFSNKFWICPSWQQVPESNITKIILDPGIAFGTGSHPTTHQCLQYLSEYDIKDKDVIDYGCGSGILAIVAAKLGAKSVVATDICDDALLSTNNNSIENKVMVKTKSVEELHQYKSDLLIANILLGPLKDLKQIFYNLIKKDKTLILSGFLLEQQQELIDYYSDKFYFIRSTSQESWGMAIFRKI